MESEEFYDSLEEDSEYDSINNTSIGKEELCEKNVSDLSEEQPDNIIPYYDKELSRSEINLSKNSSKCSALLVRKKNVTKKRGFDPDPGKLKSISYLNMFYAKTTGGNELIKSARQSSTARSNLTSKSFFSCDHSDVYSFYLENEDKSGTSVDDYPTLREIPELVLSNPNAKIKFRNTPGKNSGKPQRKSRSPQTITTTIPEMGKLGPEIPTDKLELLRRRQQYGKKVSQSNRIKMLEKKALQNLQQEMKNSRICM